MTDGRSAQPVHTNEETLNTLAVTNTPLNTLDQGRSSSLLDGIGLQALIKIAWDPRKSTLSFRPSCGSHQSLVVITVQHQEVVQV